jgi:small subunit ribosomal protein S11
MAKKTGALKKKVVKVEPSGQVHVHSSFNNIIVTLTNNSGQVISWASAGKMGFKGSKKNTPYAAQMAAEDCSKVAFDLGFSNVGIEVTEIVDVTPMPHNGCRAPGRRRV